MRLLFSIVLILCAALSVRAATIDDLKTKIDSKAKEIQQLELDIENYKKELVGTGKEITSLSQKIKSLEATKKKLAADIAVTQKKIEAAQLTIESLGEQIGDKADRISKLKDSLAQAIKNIRENDTQNITGTLLSGDSISDVIDTVERLDQFQNEVDRRLTELRTLKVELETNRKEVDDQRKNLVIMKSQLDDQKKIAEGNRVATDKILSQTKNKESNYKKLLADKMARRDEFEKELLDFESQLRIVIDPNALPPVGKGVLTWPLDNVVVTQPFGDTEFSKSHTAVYNGNGHNGVDFRASIGTPILSAQSGVVMGTGDTDKTCAGASYGKWVLVKHNNGLTTLYAHLSLIKVSTNDQVAMRQLIGYSGDTGYATGPHLHFTVFATQGVSVGNLKSKNPKCGTYTLPRASLNSYLDPMLYL